MNPDDATRAVAWNISQVWVIYVLFALSASIGGYGLYRRLRRWRLGKPTDRFDAPATRLAMLFRHAIAQARLSSDGYAGTFHSLMFGGVIVLTAATTVVFLDYDFGLRLMSGRFYLYFQSLAVDLFGGLFLVGVSLAALRRWVFRPARLVASTEANVILLWLLLIGLSGFLLEGWRIAATQDPWAAWSPLGDVVATASASLWDASQLQAAHRVTWWGHAALVFGFFAWAPYTKMLHVLSGPFNVYTANLAPIGGNLRTVDLDSAATLGARDISGFTWKDLADLDACTECGRCTDACPAWNVGKSLAPLAIILGLRRALHSCSQGARTGNATDLPAVVGDETGIAAAAIWECTTCAACVAVCPVFIEQMPKIVDMRRYLIMEQSSAPATIQEALSSLEDRGHPFRGAQSTRLTWAEGLDVPVMSDIGETQVLLWIGSAGALLERSQRTVRALARLLTAAGVKFAILGREEKDSGDLARRTGNELTFETLAQENIQTLRQYRFGAIVTACPHDFNTLKNEYPRLGADYVVHHHTEYLSMLLAQGRLRVESRDTRVVTYHDPCYLCRHNGVADAPRNLISAATGRAPVEMERYGRNSFCCGGGGGMSFVEEPADKRLNQARARQALATGADVVAVACPFCLTMMTDGVNAVRGDRDVEVVDVAELLLDAICMAETSPADESRGST